MFRVLMVPLDGSEFSEQALGPALALARRHGAAVRLVRVHEPVAGVYGPRPIPFEPAVGEPALGAPAALEPALDEALQRSAAEALDQLVQRLAPTAGVRLEAKVLEGPIAPALEQHAARIGADLIVMTTHGRGPMTRFWLGSVADGLVRHSARPILFIPPRETSSPSPSSPSAGDVLFHQVLIPLDGSALAEQVLPTALALGEGAATRYTLLRIVPTLLPVITLAATTHFGVIPESVYDALRAEHRQQEAEAKAYLARTAAALAKQSANVQTHTLSHDRPAIAILEEAAQRSADLIALSSRGQGGFKRLLLGSVADKVLRGSTVPVLIHPPAERGTALQEAAAQDAASQAAALQNAAPQARPG